GADRVVDARVKLKIKADRIIICTGAPEAVISAFDCIDRKGIILFFAIPERDIEIPIVDFWRNEITATSSYGAAPQDLAEAIKLIKDRKVDVKSMITHTLALKDIQQAFKIAASTKDALKVVLVP
ncbi:MAG: zinc-binding dehydrogenase, partial [bacterium]